MRFTHMLLLLLAIVLWSGYYVAGRYALDALPPFFITALRFALVAVVVLPLFGWPKMPFHQIVILAFLLGVVNFGCGLAAMGWGLDIPSTIIVGQLTVPFSCMFGAIILKDKLGAWRVSGLVVAMMGTVFIAGTPNVSAHYGAFVTMLIASLGWGWANILLKKYGEVPILPFWGAISLVASLPLFAISALVEEGQMQAVLAMDGKEIAGVLYLAFGSMLGAYVIWSYLLKRYLASQITPVTMMGPFVSFGLAWLFFDQQISPQAIIAGLITILGVSMIVFRKPRLAMLGKAPKPHPADKGI